MDLSVSKMNVYAQDEFSSDTAQNEPIIKMEIVRMLDGYWFVKIIKIETTNKAIFPSLDDNWEYDFFDYKRVNVEVKEIELN